MSIKHIWSIKVYRDILHFMNFASSVQDLMLMRRAWCEVPLLIWHNYIDGHGVALLNSENYFLNEIMVVSFVGAFGYFMHEYS